MYVCVPLALPMTAMVWRAPGGEATSDVKADRAASAGWGARDAGAGLEGGGGGREGQGGLEDRFADVYRSVLVRGCLMYIFSSDVPLCEEGVLPGGALG